MIYRRFAAISLCCVLFWSNVVFGDISEVIHAYRRPSEADLQWLLGDTATLIPNTVSPSGVLQAGYSTSKTGTLVPQCDPCKPARLPIPVPSIPPAPIAANNRQHTGLARAPEGVISITSTVADSSTSVVQMSTDRLPPPEVLPNDADLDIPHLSELAAERLPIPKNWETPNRFHANTGCGDNFNDGFFPCMCFTCIVCGDHRKNRKQTSHDCGIPEDEAWILQLDNAHKRYETVFCVPGMIGSSAWLTGYSVGIGGNTLTLPTMLLSRPNVVEHFNAGVQNRIWADYRSWNNAVARGNESRPVEQFSFGLEKQLLRRNSVELRVPVIYQFASGRIEGSAASVELGNVSVFLKQVLLQGSRWTVSGGGGVSLPTAEDWRPFAGARLENSAYSLSGFLGVQWHPNNSTFGHFVVQSDIPIEKNELVYAGNSVKVDGQKVIRSGVQLGRWIYRSDHGKRPCRFGAFAEVNYAVVTESSARRSLTDGADAIYVSGFGSRKSTLTAAVGVPMVFGKLTCTNSLILPISGSNRPFSVAYNVSLVRQF